MLLDKVCQSNQFSFSFKFEYFEGPLGNVLRTSWRRPESTSEGHPLNVRFGVTWTSFQGVLKDDQIESLEDVLRMLGEGNVLGTSWGPILSGWEVFMGHP